ncbi:exported hypothetical protein [Cupriavidus taiwanensis]|uniref:Uncharacterized protein n=1 Tax=Cupriavidus taiwanensis TaxID=164546 RepID=A0A375J715_9BURK|nr:exported hypothetical protein [Cupriavidus taiwanensis]
MHGQIVGRLVAMIVMPNAGTIAAAMAATLPPSMTVLLRRASYFFPHLGPIELRAPPGFSA